MSILGAVAYNLLTLDYATLDAVSVSTNGMDSTKTIDVKFDLYVRRKTLRNEALIQCTFLDDDNRTIRIGTNREFNLKYVVKLNDRHNHFNGFNISLPVDSLDLSNVISSSINVQINVFSVNALKNWTFGDWYIERSKLYSVDPFYFLIDGSTNTQYVNFFSHGGRKKFEILSNAESYNICGLPSWCRIIDKTNSSFVLECDSNKVDEFLMDDFYVQSSGKEIKIHVTKTLDPIEKPQTILEEISLTNTKIKLIDLEHNVWYESSKGVRINLEYQVSGMKDQSVIVFIRFYHGDWFHRIYDKSGEFVVLSANEVELLPFDNTIYTRTLFLPYNVFNLIGKGRAVIYYDVVIYDMAHRIIAKSDKKYFYLNGAR